MRSTMTLEQPTEAEIERARWHTSVALDAAGYVRVAASEPIDQVVILLTAALAITEQTLGPAKAPALLWELIQPIMSSWAGKA